MESVVLKKYTNDDFIHEKKGNVEYIKCRRFEKYANKFKAAFFLKHGGESKGVYNSLNFRIAGNDKKENIYENTKIAINTLDLNESKTCVIRINQSHTNKIIKIDSNNVLNFEFFSDNFKKNENYDGVITDSKNIASIITTADCMPVIIYCPDKNVYANVHSGWVGTTKKIVNNAIEILNKEYMCSLEQMIVCVGPSISKKGWKSKDYNLKNEFLKIWPFEDKYIFKENNGYYSVDFSYCLKQDILSMGLDEENIFLSNICTYTNNNDFFSYRKNTENKEKDYATMASIASLI